MFYVVKMPTWIQKLFPTMIWQMGKQEKVLYLTFDDGPHPIHTSVVLHQLKKYNAQATFFCIGNNVKKYPTIYKQIIEEGHAIGNHTFHHLNGKKVSDKEYVQDINEASKYIDSKLFRPPYGSITRFQTNLLIEKNNPYKIIMWTILSGDFDNKLSKEKCLKNVISKASNGDIIVFHDSDKAAEKMSYSLPKVLQYFSEKGFQFKKIIM